MIDRRVITDVELNRFVSGSHYVHYMKTAAWGAFKARTENSTFGNPTSSDVANPVSAEEAVAAGDCHYCQKGQHPMLINDGDEDLVFYAVVPQQ